MEGEVRKKDKELATTAKEPATAAEELAITNAKLDKKWGEVTELHQVTQDPIYQRFYDHGWNRAEEFYIRNVVEEGANAFH